MPWTQKQMLRDANGDLIPQYWDVVEQEFKPLTGRDGANDVRVTGSREEFITRSFYNIAPGEEVSTDHIKTLDYTSFYVSLWKSGTGSNIEIFKRERTSLSVVTPDDVKVLEVSGAMRQSEPEELIGSTIRFRIINTGEATADTVYFVVYGIRQLR